MNKGAVLVLGARSDIARAVAGRFAAAGHPVRLAARDAERLAADRADIGLRHGADVTAHEFDVLDVASHALFIDALPELPDIVVCAVGLMGDQQENEGDMRAAVTVLRSNFEGPACLFAELANRFAARGSGTLVGISSVAGERGRATNYVYGSAKAGFTAFLSGLRNRLARRNVHVITVLPGFVDTAMTAGMDLPPRLTARPAQVAESIFQAVGKRRDVVYVKPVWRLIMLVIRAIPEALFKTMRL